MSSNVGVYLGFAVSLIICFVVPIAGIIFMQIKYKRSLIPFLVGAATFFISQIGIRIPILQVILPQQSWFVDLQYNHYLLYYVFLGVTAGIAEEVARVIAIKFCMKKSQRYCDGISFGLGHGGIEAILLVGISYISLLVVYIMFQNGTAMNMLGMTEPYYSLIAAQCNSLSFANLIMGGIERISAMAMHIGWSVLIMTGIKKGKTIWYMILAILLHGICDASIGFFQKAGINVYGIEAILAVYAMIAVIYVTKARKDEVYQVKAISEGMEN